MFKLLSLLVALGVYASKKTAEHTGSAVLFKRVTMGQGGIPRGGIRGDSLKVRGTATYHTIGTFTERVLSLATNTKMRLER